MQFKIKPRFYQTALFKIGMAMLLFLAILLAIYSLRKAARRRLREQQQITRAQIRGQEKERQFISTELHDSINQQLSTARIYLDVAKEKETLQTDLVAKSEQVIKNTIRDINALCNSLTPPSLKDIGLREAIEELLNPYNSIERFKTHLNFQLDTNTIGEDIQFIIFRITQEQVNNIARHADAKNAWFDFQSGPAGINISIRDDGKGFDVKTKKFGMGLENIKNRLSLYHGKMEIKSAPGKGCIISLFIPQRSIGTVQADTGTT